MTREDSPLAPTHKRRPLSRRHLLYNVAVTTAAVLKGRVVWRGPLDISRHTLTLTGLRTPLRLVQLSDLHYGPYIHADQVAAWVAATQAAAPDLVVITGDLVDFLLKQGLEPLETALRPLSAPLGVFAVWGNHDYYHAGGVRVLEPLLDNLGITLLNNRGVTVRDDLYLAGIDDWHLGQPDPARALAERPAERACILLSHNPDALPKLPAGVGLTLCGHTHGGQIKLPRVGPLMTSSRYGRRFAEGWVTAPTRAYVSRGLGVSNLPLRIGCPSELVVLDLVLATGEEVG